MADERCPTCGADICPSCKEAGVIHVTKQTWGKEKDDATPSR